LLRARSVFSCLVAFRNSKILKLDISWLSFTQASLQDFQPFSDERTHREVSRTISFTQSPISSLANRFSKMTSLQRQLAAIAANSTHQLDLKAQKVAHSKSLLFDPKVAVSQDFNTLYQLCYEGFEELRLLDNRFSPFSTSLFSEQSKAEEREQWTADQNKELDTVLEDFLGLVGSRILLKPAQKALEWLIRRFR